MERKEKEWLFSFGRIALEIASHSSCCRKKVAALVVKNKRIISTGINGAGPGQLECSEYFHQYSIKNKIDSTLFNLRLNTPGDEINKLHHDFAEANEIHSEQNAIAELSKNEVSGVGADIIITLSPCSNCAKLIVAAGIKRVFFLEAYDRDDNGIKLCKNSGLEVFHIDLEEKLIERL